MEYFLAVVRKRTAPEHSFAGTGLGLGSLQKTAVPRTLVVFRSTGSRGGVPRVARGLQECKGTAKARPRSRHCARACTRCAHTAASYPVQQRPLCRETTLRSNPNLTSAVVYSSGAPAAGVKVAKLQREAGPVAQCSESRLVARSDARPQYLENIYENNINILRPVPPWGIRNASARDHVASNWDGALYHWHYDGAI